jgi:hypothetical protein
LIEGVTEGSGDVRPFVLRDEDMVRLEAAIVDTQAVAVLIDPLFAFWGDEDSYKDNEIRRVLTPLAKIAERTNCAIIVTIHITKDASKGGWHRMLGGVGFGNAARVVHGIHDDPNDPTLMYFGVLKANWLPRDTPSLRFRIQGVVLEDGLETSRCIWDGAAALDVKELFAATRSGEKQNQKVEEAKDFLEKRLAGGPVLESLIEDEAKRSGVSRYALKEARKALSVESKKNGYQGSWCLSLPRVTATSSDSAPKSTTHTAIDSFGAPRTASPLESTLFSKRSTSTMIDSFGRPVDAFREPGLPVAVGSDREMGEL